MIELLLAVRKRREPACARPRLLHTAELVLEEPSTQGFSNVAAGTAVLAGIAASDSICCSRLRKLRQGQDHRGAVRLLEEATPDGKALAATLATATSRVLPITAPPLSRADVPLTSVKWARKLADRAREELEQ